VRPGSVTRSLRAIDVNSDTLDEDLGCLATCKVDEADEIEVAPTRMFVTGSVREVCFARRSVIAALPGPGTATTTAGWP
jgi:hypothetical protein